ncbi:predicted protein [Methanosarcina acetivorans C2A]|uniref:Uncharacterized protein n=1 Tax=Methanosarcina acetivorans (strain ATCC 35395 / DSM 2834 / JCM 12185 / C2A) TaxID=188937 RepID=Q8TPX4_METAC|nr:predicted protein [Methanosarcina acetivorans C2A]
MIFWQGLKVRSDVNYVLNKVYLLSYNAYESLKLFRGLISDSGHVKKNFSIILRLHLKLETFPIQASATYA